jgi:hypothetical protein
MTKSVGEYEPTKPISKAEREARKAFRHVEAEKAMSEHALAEKAFAQNRERLKAERLAREAAAGPVPKRRRSNFARTSARVDLAEVTLKLSAPRSYGVRAFPEANESRPINAAKARALLPGLRY